jgi:hypothetical protein
MAGRVHMDEKDFKKHLKDLAEGHHHPEEHDWAGDAGASAMKKRSPAKKAAPAKKTAVKKKASKRAAK